MDCTTVSAALVAVCLHLPDLGDRAPDIKEPTYEDSWLLGEVPAEYRARRTYWHTTLTPQAELALGSTRRRQNVFGRRKTLFLIHEDGPWTWLVTPDTASLAYTVTFK